jgi:flagellar M-ring protein FliF
MATEAQAPAPLFSIEAFNRLSTRQKLVLIAGTALAVAVVVVTLLWARTPDYGVLFSGLSERDGGQIVTALQQQNIPYKISEGGGAIMVPTPLVHDTRLKLASQGLPHGGLVGFEVMENQKLGASQFLEQVNYQRALEGELARSIQSLQAVHAARVHLAIPKQTAFLRDELKPTASVLVSLNPGRVLDPGQVAGIVHLVSSSVPELTPGNVSVIDQDGNLISAPSDPSRNAGLDPAQLKYVHDLEQSYIRRIETILAAVTGLGNVKAQVAADIDFSQTEQVAEIYDPNPAPKTAIRSQQSSESGSTEAGPAGVPGALSNQPPVPATAPLTTPPAPGTPGATGKTQAPTSYNKSSTINYEVDKTVRHTTGVPGVIKRLSVAVVVNQKKASNGKAVPLSDAEMSQINALTREAMGFNKDRGDTLNIANVPFISPEASGMFETQWWRDPEIIAWATAIAKYLILAIIAFLVWTRLLKPLFQQLQRAAAEAASGHPGAGLGEGLAGETAGAGPSSYETKVEQARQLAKDDPKLVANVIKEWIGGSEQR